jgi:hypothetical protein
MANIAEWGTKHGLTEVQLPVQAMESRLVLARALAKMWFGVFLRMRVPTDAWLLEGLAAHLEGVFVRTFLGRNELLYRCAPLWPSPSCFDATREGGGGRGWETEQAD